MVLAVNVVELLDHFAGYVIIGFCTALPGVMAWMQSRKYRKAIGTPNGHGNVIQMVEQALKTQARIESVQAEIVDWQASHDVRDERQFAELRKKIEHLTKK